MTFHFTDLDGDHLYVTPTVRLGKPAINFRTRADDHGGAAVDVPVDQLEDLIAGIRETGRQAAARGQARLVKVDGILAEGDAETAREALQQMEDDPHGLKAGLIVKPYREHGQEKWVFRCWGTDDGCDGFLSLDHTSEQSAQRARDRHLAEEHHAQPN